MIRLILFDIDGTLIRTGGAGVKAFEETFREGFGIPDATRTMNFAGRTDTSLVREGFLQHGINVSDENTAKFFRLYTASLERLLQELPGEVCPGVHPFISELQQMAEAPALGLLTGNIRRGAELKLSYYKLWHHFPFGGFGDDHEDRNCIADVAHRRGIEHTGVSMPGDEVLVIGDTPLDIACARAIKAKVMAVGTGNFTAEQLLAYKPDYSVPTLEHLSATEICLS